MRPEIIGRKFILATDEQRTFYEIFQFTDIARIRQRHQEASRICPQLYLWQSVLAALAFQKVGRQQRDVLAAFTQSGQTHGDEIDAIEKVLAKGMLADHLLQVGIRSTHHAHVGLARPAVAQRFVGLVLKHTQELHLTGRIELADFIKKNRTALGQFETPDTISYGICKCSLSVTEHFAFKQTLRHAAQIHLDKRPSRAPAIAMDGLGHKFLTRTVLAHNQYGSVRGSYAPDYVEHLHNGRTAAHDQAAVEPIGRLARIIGTGVGSKGVDRKL